jgi:hypothetical protein
LLSVLLVLLLGLARPGHAQLYYLTTNGTATSQTANDALNRLNTADNTTSTVISSIAVSPTLLALDPANNRAFVYEALTTSRGIKVYSLTGTPALLYTLPVPAQVSAIEYDVVGDYVYFLTTDASATDLTATDALNRIKADNSSASQVLVPSVANSPVYLALNAAGNRAYVYEGLTASRGIKTVNLATNTLIGSTIPVAAAVAALDYARSNGNLYFLTSDGAAASQTANDALYKVLPTDSGTPPTPTAVITSLSNSPSYLALDLANNRIYVGENLTSTRGFRIINTTTNAVTTVSQPVQFAAIEILQQIAPTVTTATPASITSNRAVLGGNVTNDGGATVTERGVVYSTTNQVPTTSDTKDVNGSGAGSFSETITGLAAATTYYVRAYATNAVGTSYGAATSFTTLNAVSGTTVVTNVSCFNGSNGTINLTPTGGVGPYTFVWNNGATTEDRTGLSAGTYSVTITDAAGATGAVNNIVVGQPTSALLVGTTSQTTIACNGGATGAASISPVGGTAPYTYRWSTGATTQGISGLRAATYTVTVTDANGCTLTRSFNITEPTVITATTSQTDVTTSGGSNGSATITVSGGTPSYTYAWSPNVSTTATASNLRAGSYTVTAADAYGCTITRSFTIAEPANVTVASITRLTPSPTATTQVRYQVVFSGSVSGLTVSNFSVTQTGLTGASISSVVGSGTTYTVTASTGTGDGTLRVNVANSTGISPTVTNVPYTAGEAYTITKSFTNPVLTIQGTGGSGTDVTAFVDAVQVLSNGTAVANALQNGSFEQHDPLSNGDFGYQPTGASWTFNTRAGIAESGSAFTPTTPIPNGIAVAFIQSNRDQNGQVQNGQIQQGLTVPTGSYQVNFQASQRICCTTLDQSLNVFINGVFVGTILPGENNYQAFTSTTFSVTAPALTASISSTAGASGSTTATSPIPFTVTFSQSATGFTASDLVVAGGTVSGFTGSGTTYTFNVTPSASGNTVTVTVPANSAFDGNNTGNTASSTYTINTTTVATITTATPSGITSNRAVLGGSVTADGGSAVTERGVVYSTTNQTPTTANTKDTNGTGTGAFSETITGLASATTYYVRAYAINSAGTSYGAAVSFTTLNSVSGTAVVTNVSCFNGSNGTINLTPTGGVAPYTFVWNDGATTEDRTGLTAGAYSVTITDAAGATGVVNNIIVTQPSALVATTVQTNIACNGGTNGTAAVTPAGGTAPYTYRWSTGATTQGLTGLAAGSYSVTVTDANGCTIVSNLTITQPTPLVATTSQTDATTIGGSNGSATITVSGGTPSYTYAWSPNVSTTATASNLRAGSYTVTATDANGCTITRSFTIGQPSTPTITITPATLANGTVGTAYSQTITASGGTAPYSYGLTAGALPTGLSLTSAGTLSGTPTAGGTFNFTVTATDAGSFTGSRAYTVTVTAPTITVAPASLPAGTVAAAYSQTITASGGTAPYSFAVTAGTLPTGLTLTSAGVLSGTPTVSSTFNFTVTATDASTGSGAPYSGSFAYSLTIASPANTVWTGNVSTDWLTAGNWTAGVPDAAVDAIIPANAPRYPTLAANAAAKNLSLNSGATLTHTSGTLTLTANLTNNGTYTAPIPAGGAGAIVSLGSTQLASILGSSNTRFRNLTIGASGAQASTSASTSVQRLFTLNGSFATNGNPLTLESNVNATAMVINNGTSVLSGTVTVQRYIVPDLNPGLGYRHVSTPISNATVASLTTGSFTPVVNPAYNTSATPTSERPFPTIYGYDQSRLATTTNNLPAFDKGWFSPAALSDAMTVGQGYTVNIGAGQTWNFVGAVNNGNISQTLTRNAGATSDDSGLQLVGNPYPSPLNWQNVASADHPGVDDVIYVWQSNTPGNPYAGNYRFYQNNFGNVSPVLALGQAFFVRVKAGQTSGTLNLNNSHRSTTYTNPTYHRTAAETRPTVQLTLKGAGSVVTDDAFVYFQEGATNGYDSGFDAEKLVNPSGLNLSTSLSAKQRLSIDGRGLLGTTQQVVPLAVGVPAVGSYSLSTTQLLNLDATPVYLRDLQLGTVTDLRTTPSYQFTVANASALITGRFELVFSPQQALATTPAALAQQVALYPNPAKKAAFVELPASLGRQAVTASLVDALGRQVRTVSLPAQGALAHQLDLSELATGVYALRLSTSAGVVVKKLVIE